MDLYDIVRTPEQMCDAIDRQDSSEHYVRILQEYNDWMTKQQRQQEYVQQVLREYYR